MAEHGATRLQAGSHTPQRPLMAAAHAVASFPFFLFATCVAVIPACLRSRRALWPVFRRLLAPAVVAWWMKSSALLSFRITLQDGLLDALWLVSAAPRYSSESCR